MKMSGPTISRWTGGCNSLLHPSDLGQGQYVWSLNCINRGGIVQTRPGYEHLASIVSQEEGKLLQGSVIFTPSGSRPVMLVAVDGVIWIGKFPFESFAILEGIRLSATSKNVHFQRCTKNIELNNDGTLSLIDSKPMVIIQDGSNVAHSYDGLTVRSLPIGAPGYGPPVGTWMAWAGNRLWVAAGSRLYASDLASPDTFSEDTYLAERSSFELPGPITGMVELPNRKGLAVFTDGTTTVFQSNIRDRRLWQETRDFQEDILPSIGCVAGRSPTNQYGMTWWFSRSGWISLDTAIFSENSTHLSTKDEEMIRSKSRLAEDITGICSGTLENFMLISVPVGGRHNEETWVMDQTPAGQGRAGQAWVGVWTGMRPFQWMRASYLGRERLYCVAYDKTEAGGTPIHVWEVFRDERSDGLSRIICQMETGMFTSDDLLRFEYIELELIEILGEVEVQAYFAGTRGAWHKIMDTVITATEGSVGGPFQLEIDKTSILQGYAPQARSLKSETFTPQDRACSADSNDVPGLDKGFQLLVQWRGQMGIKEIKLMTKRDPSADTGKCNPSEAGQVRIITERGETITE